MFFRADGWMPLSGKFYTKIIYYDILIFFKGTHYHFIREIPMLSCYEVRTSIAAWDQKWVRQPHYSELFVGN